MVTVIIFYIHLNYISNNAHLKANLKYHFMKYNILCILSILYDGRNRNFIIQYG